MDAVSRLHVSGWAADSETPDRPLEISILVDNEEVGRTIADRPRRDVTALGRFGEGGHGFLFVFPQPLASAANLSIVVRYADTDHPLPNGERNLPPEAEPAPPPATAKPVEPSPPTEIPGPNAVLVTAPGRSGTTYLMSCLAAAPEIVVAELVPYEVRLLAYYATAFKVLTAKADTERSTHPDRLEGDGFHVGFNPFNAAQYAHAFRGRAALDAFQDDWMPEKIAASLADIVREYYRLLALDRGKGAVASFAEKNNNLHQPTRMFVRRAFPAMREIAIVRDPRDVLCSHMAYFSSSQDKAFAQLSHSCRQLTELQDSATDDLCFIRYEDMVRGDAETFDRLSRFLNATIKPALGSGDAATFKSHGTSSSPEASIGRWRRDLPADIRVDSTQSWEVFLQRFGYRLD